VEIMHGVVTDDGVEVEEVFEVKLWESFKDLSDLEVDRNRRRDCTGSP